MARRSFARRGACLALLGVLTAQTYGGDILTDRSPIAQPYGYLSGGRFAGPWVRESPDPLVAYRWTNTQPSEALQVYVLRCRAATTTRPESFAGLASLNGDSPNVTVTGSGSIKLDFGVESPAWVEFDSPDLAGNVEMSVSEFNEPWPGKTRPPVRHGDTYRLELNRELYEGVRFAWIHVKTCRTPWHITGVRAVCQVKPTNYLGSFSCSDPVLTRSWYMAAYGVKVGFCQDYFGAILMERGDRISWTGDAHTAQAAALVAFGNYGFIRKNIDGTADQDNGIRSYALYWVLSLLDYYRYTGDTDTLVRYLANACHKLDSAYAVFGKDPALGFYGWDERLGAGFELGAYPCPEAQRAYQMLSIRAWHEFAATMDEIGRRDLRDRYEGLAQAKFREATRDGNWASGYGLHAAAEAIDTDLVDRETCAAFYTMQFSDRVNRLSFSPFNEYFVLRALAKLGRWEDALISVRDLWGGMLEYGGTNAFEVYRPSWNAVIGRNAPVPNNQCGITSLSHPWGGGVVKWLSEEVLGIRPTSAGFDTYEVRPHLGSSLRWVRGAMPTPHGSIEVAFDAIKGAMRLVSPRGTVGRIAIPKVGRQIARVVINGELAWDGAFHAVKGVLAAGEDADFVTFSGVAAGAYAFKISYVGRTPSQPIAGTSYPCGPARTDSTTHGDWGGRYGRDGYVLFGVRPDGGDQASLPSSIASVDSFRLWPRTGRAEGCVWVAATKDRRALAAEAGNGLPRTAACIYNSDQTFTVTVKAKGTAKYRVALYFVDWDRRGRQVAVEMFDAETLRLLAPVAVVSDFERGKYLVYECDRSVKFRLDRVRGDNATLSGIFFDGR